jgi:hypothetical protein
MSESVRRAALRLPWCPTSRGEILVLVDHHATLAQPGGAVAGRLQRWAGRSSSGPALARAGVEGDVDDAPVARASLHGYGDRSASWTFANDRSGWRLDQVLRDGLQPGRKRLRRSGPGDHSALIVDLEP